MISFHKILQNKITKIFDIKDINIYKSNNEKYDYSINITSISKNKNLSLEQIKNIFSDLFENDQIFEIFFDNNYVNISIKEKYYQSYVHHLIKNNLSFSNQNREKIIIDYSSPNIAKDMHVGHLRSTIIGDCIANLFEETGNQVMRINHIGDYGLPFAMIIQYVLDNKLENKLDTDSLQNIYKESKRMYEQDEKFKQKSITTLSELHKETNIDTINLWKKICDISKKSYDHIYKLLDVHIKEQGESFYKNMIGDLIDELKKNDLLFEEEGRFVVETPSNDDNRSLLTIIKKDGSYTYDTTDLCALKYRLIHEKADKIFYVVDSGQSNHFKQIFYVAEKLKWKKQHQNMLHINFGVVCDSNGKRIKSRSGDNVTLLQLITEAEKRTTKIMQEFGNNDEEIIKKLTIGSLKYADLSWTRTNDYNFSFKKMINFKGNTLAFIMYAYVRCNSIIQKIKEHNIQYDDEIIFSQIDSKDMKLLKILTDLPNVLTSVFNDYMPHKLCRYIFDLASLIHHNYSSQKCIIMSKDKKNIEKVNTSRINIYLLAMKHMEYSFKILGIHAINKM